MTFPNWFLYFHHTLIHLPIVLSPLLAIIGTYWFTKKQSLEAKPLENLVRYLGLTCALLTTCAAISGFGAADFEITSLTLRDHRDFGLLTTILTIVAALSFEWGIRNSFHRVTQFGALSWWIVTYSAIGTAHWGALLVHQDIIPF